MQNSLLSTDGRQLTGYAVTEATDYLRWSKRCPPGGHTITPIVPDPNTAEPLILVECRAPTEPGPRTTATTASAGASSPAT